MKRAAPREAIFPDAGKSSGYNSAVPTPKPARDSLLMIPPPSSTVSRRALALGDEDRTDSELVRGPARWALVVAFGVIYLSWGTTYLAVRTAVHDERMPPALFMGTRIGSAGLILLTYQLARGRSLRLSGRDFLRLFGVSILLFLLANWLISVAQIRLASGMAAVLVATTPLWMGLFSLAWPHGDRLSARGWLGLLLGLAGVLILLAPRLSDPTELLRDFSPLLVLGSAAAWALGSLLLRHAPVSLPHLSSAGYQMLLGGSCQIVLGLSLGEAERVPLPLTPGAIGSFFYLLVVGSLLGFVAYNWLLGHVAAAKVGTYAYVNPVIAILLGWLTGEALTATLLAGIAVILAGVYLVRDQRLAPAPD
jgi:drug/metabolite transporter (DMT)-like permease